MPRTLHDIMGASPVTPQVEAPASKPVVKSTLDEIFPPAPTAETLAPPAAPIVPIAATPTPVVVAAPTIEATPIPVVAAVPPIAADPLPDAAVLDTSPIDDLLTLMVEAEASDLHIKVGSPPGLRVSGSLSPIPEFPALKAEDTWRLINVILNPEQLEQFKEDGDCDLAYSAAGLGRFRVNAMMQRGSAGMVLRRIPHEIPSMSDLHLPKVCETLVMRPRGMVLITGPTGSGKSTTLASMIDFRNRQEAGHILTLEDPIEFVHSDRKSFVNQREVGADTKSFSDGLRRALRQDPDVILIGELRDLETISMALTAAETGHLVLATLHTTGAVQTVDRIVDVFPPEQQQQVRLQLSGALQGVISQVLVPKRGGGRVAALEILIAVDGVRACIREGKTPQLVNALQTGGRLGMTLLDASLAKLVRSGEIELTEGMAKANKPEEFKALVTG